jgi:hypothetical protein
MATTGLSTKLDHTLEELNSFLGWLSDQVNLYDWSNVLIILDRNAIPCNIMREYGLLTTESCRNHAATYLRAQTLQAQNALMLYTCIISSLTEEASEIILSSDMHDFTVLALKALILRSSVDTAGTAMTLPRAAGSLKGKLIELHSDIREFNLYITDALPRVTTLLRMSVQLI